MQKFTVSGMSCASCSARVEKAVSSISGVEKCSVNLLTNSMTVEGNVSEKEIIDAVRSAGYDAETDNGKKEKAGDDDKKTKFVIRVSVSSALLLILMYFSMGHMMWGWKLPDFFEKHYIYNGIVQLILTIIIMLINKNFFTSGIKAILSKAPNMDTLVALGSGAAFVYSLYSLALMILSYNEGNHALAHEYMHDLYFESAAMILTLITVGKALEAYSKGKTTSAISSLIDLSPQFATVYRDGKEIIIPADEVVKDDVFTVLPGKSIPADGVVIEGESSVNESALTGESIPSDKHVGDKVFAATINQSGYIKCRATQSGKETVFSKIIEIVTNASAQKAPIAKMADKVSSVFVPIVLAIAVATFVIWKLFGYSLGFSLARAISVLVISCPCALGLATPVAIMVAGGRGAKHSILYKTAEAIETSGRVKIVAFDKTGTITNGNPVVTDVYAAGDEKLLLDIAFTLEKKSEHPLAKAICEYAKDKAEEKETVSFKALIGSGIYAVIDGKECFGGSLELIKKHCNVENSIIDYLDNASENGKTALLFSYGSDLLGVICVRDEIKEDSFEAIKSLKKMGVKSVMLTGDNKKTASAIAKKAGIDSVYAHLKPDEKEKIIKELKKHGKVAMVGDGINDAPALASADVGIAIGAGTDIAIESADIVLVKNSLKDVYEALMIGRLTLKNIKENLFWAFFYNVIGIPLAAGVLIPKFSIRLNPMFAAMAMSLSSICVVTNALRLNYVKEKKKNMVTIKLKVDKMMCSHCENSVVKALEAISGVTSASASHVNKEVIVEADESVKKELLEETIENLGYDVIKG